VKFKGFSNFSNFRKKWLADQGCKGINSAVARQGGPTEMPPRLLGFPRGMIGRAASFLPTEPDDRVLKNRVIK
jgi:hypothetical protein